MHFFGGAICAFVLVGCWGSSPSDRPAGQSPLASSSPLDGISVCTGGAEREVAIDETTPAGFSAEDLLASIEGEHDEEIRWTMPEGLTVGPERGERTLRVIIERSGDRARELDPSQDGIGHGSVCQAWVIVPVTVTMRSEDGALNDRFAGEVYAMDPRVAYLSAESTELSLAGKLSVARESEPEHLASETFELAMTLSEHGATGTLSAVWTTLDIENMFFLDETLQIADFGDASCDVEAASLPLDAPVTAVNQVLVTGQDLIDAFNAATSVTIDWASGESTEASLNFTPDRDGACAAISVDYDDRDQKLSVPGMLELRSDDGRVDARWPGGLRPLGFADDGTVIGYQLLASYPLTDLPDPTPADLGFPLASDGDLDTFSVSYEVTIVQGVVSGSIALIGFQNLDTGCPLPDGSGCDFSGEDLEAGTLR